MSTSEDLPEIELGQAIRVFHNLVPAQSLNALQDPDPRTVYTPWIVSWLMVYQRLSGYVTLAEALAEVARFDDDLLPKNKRTRERSISSNTGGYSRGRKRLGVAVAEFAADQVSDALIARTRPSLQNRRVFLIDGS